MRVGVWESYTLPHSTPLHFSHFLLFVWRKKVALTSLLLQHPLLFCYNFKIEFYFLQDLHAGPRTLLPHGASFHGYPITINVSSDLPRQEFTLQVCVRLLCWYFASVKDKIHCPKLFHAENKSVLYCLYISVSLQRKSQIYSPQSSKPTKHQSWADSVIN